MKSLFWNSKIYILLLTQILCVNFVNAQSRIVSTVEKESGNATTGYGRDFWFAIPLNGDLNDNSTKYFQVYVTPFIIRR